MGRLTSAALPSRSPTVDAIEIEDDLLLYDGQHLRLLTGPAAAIWRAVDGGRSVADVARFVAGGTSSSSRIAKDVLAFLEELADRDLIVIQPPDGRARYTLPGHIGHVTDGGQTLLVDMRTGRRKALTPSGGQVWALICACPDPVAMVQELEREHPDAPSTLSSEVYQLLEELVTAGFLCQHGQSDAAGVAQD